MSVPSVRALSEKRQQTWTREILLSMKDRDWEKHVRTISNENDQLEQDYRLKFERLVRLSRNINRISPAASFLDASSEIAGTGIGEESRLKQEVVRYKDSIIDKIIADQRAGDKQYPAFIVRAAAARRDLRRGRPLRHGLARILQHPLVRPGLCRLHPVRREVRT